MAKVIAVWGIIAVVSAVLLASLGAGLLSVRRIATLDPATAAGAR